ncbi:membrane integrity-associated transporter subunit PqiC [uncultured Roseobacter sp.]|uniref:PqiC family protein n=1 Tax=uncultured Roseobacter sp. TaxID=114847 RepID=UPI0026146077|nr:ABC-type transport auxiliary lipoprotein family protein [uncultured Roseobacter sp.]
MISKAVSFAGLALLVLTACGAAPDRYVVPDPTVTERQRIAFRAVEIREVSLPAYAASDEIPQQDTDGRLSSDGGTLWADTPERAVALELARHLARLSGARVASAPWPFESFPDARLDLRFESLVAEAEGRFRATGQYFVAVPDGRRERWGLFDLTVPFDPAGGPQAIATARGQIILDLAAFVAANGLR